MERVIMGLRTNKTGEQDARDLLNYGRTLLRPRLPGRHGSAPMSNKIQRFLFVLQILAGTALPIFEAFWLNSQPQARRLPEQAWGPGFWTSVVFSLCIGGIWALDHYGITADSPLESRHREKRWLTGVSAGLTLLMGLLALIQPH